MFRTVAPPSARPSAAPRLLVALVVLLVSTAGAPPAAAQAPGEDKALGAAVTASSTEQELYGNCARGVCPPAHATDGLAETRWASAFSEPHFLQVDLGRARLVDAVSVEWQYAYAERYELSTSLDGITFTPAATVALPPGLRRDHWVERTSFTVRGARYVRIDATRRADRRYGFSLYTVSVFGPDEAALAAAAPAPAIPPPAGAPSPAPGGSGATPPAAGAAGASGTAGTAGTAGTGAASAAAGAAATAAGPTAAAPDRPALRPIRGTLVRLRGAATTQGTSIQLLSVRAPKAATVRVRCTGGGCPRGRVPTRRGSRRFPELRRQLRVGAVLEVFVTQRGTSGRYTRFEIRRRRAPLRTDACVVDGSPVSCQVAEGD